MSHPSLAYTIFIVPMWLMFWGCTLDEKEYILRKAREYTEKVYWLPIHTTKFIRR